MFAAPLVSYRFSHWLLLLFVGLSWSRVAWAQEEENTEETDLALPPEIVLPEAPPPPPDPPNAIIAQLGDQPNWASLDPYQRTITRDEFQFLLDHCYAQIPDAYDDYIVIEGDRARIMRQSNHPWSGYYDLYFLTDKRKPAEIPRYWQAPWKMPPIKTPERPLEGVHVAVDPGHIGGEFSRKEGRFYTIGDYTQPVLEGEMALRVAEILKRDLGRLGAKVSLVRETNDPVTHLRPKDLLSEAKSYLVRSGKLASRDLTARTADRMFYVSSEIRERAKRVNEEIKPDLVLCLHFNAEAWRDPNNPSFSSRNHLHLILNGCYARSEIAQDDERLEMLKRLLQRVYYPEVAMSDEVANRMKEETRLDQFGYSGKSGKAVSDNDLVWARNLLANRVYECPVLFFEPYVMNNREVHARVQAGEYLGLKEFGGIARKNIFQEYADGITAGLVNYYRRVRGLDALQVTLDDS